MRRPPLQQALGLAVWLALTFAAAAAGSLASRGSESFYLQLDRPAWAPPSSWFGPVWSALYLMVGVAAWLVWRERGLAAGRVPLGLFLLQLVANGLWTWLFFAWRRGALAFAEILLLWALVLATLVTFWRVRPLAGGLLIPYLLWTSFAAALTFSIWQRNPQIL